MTGLRLDVQWAEADEVSSPELAATWARLAIFIGEDCLSLVKDTGAGGYREGIDVSVYPLAEWAAFNWWFLTSPNAGRPAIGTGGRSWAQQDRERHCLAAAGDGFPWPDLVLLPERDRVLASQSRSRKPQSRVQFVRTGQYVLDLQETVYVLERFVDSVVRRLEDQGVAGTRLHDEWTSIQETSADERAFCQAAAALGADPYALDEAEAERIVAAASRVSDEQLFLELLPGLSLSELDVGVDWLISSLESLRTTKDLPESEMAAELAAKVGVTSRETGTVALTAPWKTGYQRGGMVREALGLGPTTFFEPSDFVAHKATRAAAPGLIQGLARLDAASRPLVVTPDRSAAGTRFIETRVLSRVLFEQDRGTQVVTHGSSTRDRVERAFAAELLAPALGVEELLGGDLSLISRGQVAKHFGVNPLLIDHQIENQLGIFP